MSDLSHISDKPEIPMFADDTTSIQSHKGSQHLLSSEMIPVCNSLWYNKLIPNRAKCAAMCFGFGKPDKTKQVSAELHHGTSSKNLGTHLVKKLFFHEHNQ